MALPTVGDIMREVKTVTPEMSAAAALAMMRDAGVSLLVVVREDRPVGVVSTRDYRHVLEWLRPDGRLPVLSEITIAEVMAQQKPVIVAGPEMSVIDAARLLIEHRISSLPVVDQTGRAIGIVGPHDVLAAVVALVDR